ncbi:phage tail protein [Gallibacterium genomosp. 2]|uniref:phage tail-collar fiber domain-containing protein n=1 Tax=Gallibacterium genomosp. 2 TaxID=155517 RepID=UPI00068ACFE2|nr:phage tail protein [Gallibacterium genomosp. 2]
MASKLTQAFETYIRDSVVNHTPVVFDEFIFANIPGLNDGNLDSHLTIPQANKIVHRQAVSQIGALNENAIVYSVTIGTEIGDFDFNWVGLVNKSQNLLACGIYTGLTSKIKNKEQKQGNSITRSVLLEFPRAQELANVSVSAETWQIDFTMRLSGIDEKIRLTNRDLYGRAVFFDNAFLLKRKSGNVYTLDSGRAYIEGVRAEIKRTAEVTVPTLPASIYIDVCHHATVTGAYQTEIKYLTQSKNDYVGSDGYQHYVQIIADIASNGTITDRRLTDNAPPYIAESKKSSSVSSTSKETVATSYAVKTAYDKAVDGVNEANAAQTAANKAQTTANAAIPSSKKSDSVTSASSDTVATSKAVKTAYDKAVDAYIRAETAESNAKAASLPITGGNLTGNLTAPYINVTGRYISVNTPNSEFGGFDVIRQGNAGNWLSRLEALPDKRWKFWTQDAHEIFVPAKSGTLAIDHEVVHKTGDTMNWLGIENTGAWLTIKSTGQAASGIDFINHNGRYPQVSLHAFDVGGWADELRIFATPPGNDYNTDRRQHVMTVTHEGNIWSRMYGWLGDRFMDKTKAYDNWYPNHYLGAQVFKIPIRADGSGLKIIIMQVNISRDTELWLPESFNGFYIPTATDVGVGKYSLGIVSLSGNQVKVFCSGSNVTIQVHCIGWSN